MVHFGHICDRIVVLFVDMNKYDHCSAIDGSKCRSYVSVCRNAHLIPRSNSENMQKQTPLVLLRKSSRLYDCCREPMSLRFHNLYLFCLFRNIPQGVSPIVLLRRSMAIHPLWRFTDLGNFIFAYVWRTKRNDALWYFLQWCSCNGSFV